MKILDCTLRDGGYYTNWDFDRKTVDTYIDSCNDLPVDYLEIGYRSTPQAGYLGEYFYLPLYVIQRIKKQSNKKLAILLNEKDINAETVGDLLRPCIDLISLVRIAVAPHHFARGLTLAKAVKDMGFEVGINVMYMSKWKEHKDFLSLLPEMGGIADYFYMVDSYGSVYPEDVREIYQLVRSFTDVPIGFHGHNNLELALINTLTAIECGAEIVDATVTGMGRGAGNLKTELLLTALNARENLDFNFNALTKAVDVFTRLQELHNWGTNLPYMFSGANSLPQKEVMDWVSKRYYSFNSIITALNTQSKGTEDDNRLPVFNPETEKHKTAVIVGGGPSALQHEAAIKHFLEMNQDVIVVHASSKNAMAYKTIPNKQFFCLVGNEGYRMEEVFSGDIPQAAICVLPPSPRKMGTYIPNKLSNRAYELKEITFTDKYKDSHTAIALQTAIQLGVERLLVVGYDGYLTTAVSTKERELVIENEYLFNNSSVKTTISARSLTPTLYGALSIDSIYKYI